MLRVESVEAHEAVKPTKEQVRKEVLAEFMRAGYEGMTADELAAKWHCTANHVAPRITELRKAGLLRDTIYRRVTRQGCTARVLRAKEFYLHETRQ